MSAELMMCQFIAMHNIPFLAADHYCPLCFLTPKIIASYYAFKHTKTNANLWLLHPLTFFVTNQIKEVSLRPYWYGPMSHIIPLLLFATLELQTSWLK